jgi:hypothetical protein
MVDHPVEEYITRAQMAHDAPLNEADMPSVDVSIFFWLRVLRTKKDLCRLSSTGALYMSWYCVCPVHMSWFCVLWCVQGIVHVKAVCFVFWYKAWSCMIRSRIRGFL